MTLRDKRCLFTRRVALLIQEAEARGDDIALNEVLRSQAQADANAKAGTGISHSLHTVGLAVDIALYRGGTYLTRSEDYRELGEWWESGSDGELHFCWGGNFKRPDGNHFSVENEGVR